MKLQIRALRFNCSDLDIIGHDTRKRQKDKKAHIPKGKKVRQLLIQIRISHCTN